MAHPGDVRVQTRHAPDEEEHVDDARPHPTQPHSGEERGVVGRAEHNADDCQDANFTFFVRIALAGVVLFLLESTYWSRGDDDLNLVAHTTFDGGGGGGGDRNSTWRIAIARAFYLDKLRLPGDGVVVTRGKSLSAESKYRGWELSGL